MAGGCENRFRPFSDVKQKEEAIQLFCALVVVVVIVDDPMDRKSEIAVLIIE